MSVLSMSVLRMRALSRSALTVSAVLGCLVSGCGPGAAEPRAAIAMHGEPGLPAGFTAMPYANPDAPRGGQLTKGVYGTFDTLNPFNGKGEAPGDTDAPDGSALRGTVFESLMTRNYDEPFTLYGLIAESIDTDADRTFATFEINPRAAFSDGTPVTADDVVFSWQLLRDHGHPRYRIYYAKVTAAATPSPHTVRFEFGPDTGPEMPLILGLMPVLPRHATDPERFEATTLAPLTGSGPYVVGAVDAGRSLTLNRNPAYWGRGLAVNRGLWNFDTIRFDYYRETNTQFEAFKRSLFDIFHETDPGRWETGYDVPAIRDGRIVKEVFPSGLPVMTALVFNTRRPVFSDMRVREAIATLFDFEWLNRNFFYGQYRRTASFFEGSDLSAYGRPASAAERALLAPFPGAVRDDVMAGTWSPPVSDGSGRDRDSLRRALTLFRAAGFELNPADLVLRRRDTGEPLSFEIMIVAGNHDQERLALTFAESLKRAGVEMRVRAVDRVQYEERRINFDFDMIQNRWDQSLSPGNEQLLYWSSAAASEPGSRNYMGMRSPAADAMIAALLAAREREDFVTAVRALDRVLMSGIWVVPLYHLPVQWVARSRLVHHPAVTSLWGFLPKETWWRDAGGP